ncbi:MAG: hypothetical protein Q8909_11930 [Bacteroidota bacterium]|nr:hypothetical protein [Bacteroidota bacterium]
MNTLPKFRSLLFLLLCVSGLHAVAQTQTARQQLVDYAKHFATFANLYPQEKVYLHFDNNGYFLGETLWFKAYVVMAERNALSPLSKTLYVELLSPDGNLLQSEKLEIENGQCHGEFQLNSLKQSGFYEVRAYTRGMLNFGKEVIFSRVFPIYDKPAKDGQYDKPSMSDRYKVQAVPGPRKEYSQRGKLNISFFPEGGNLVVGLKSKIAFKATGKNGESAVTSGVVYDEQGHQVADFDTGYMGMGEFEFTPGAGKYKVKAQYQNSEYTFELPKAQPDGYVITVNNLDNDKLSVLIQRSQETAPDSVGLSLSCRGRLYAFESEYLGTDNQLLVNIPKKLLPTGVIQVSLFNKAGEVLAERLAFINHHSQMTFDVAQSQPTYKPYEKAGMDFLLKDHLGNPVETSFSVAVHDASSSFENPYKENILTNLLLSSELKGYIENPAFYFESDNYERGLALDLLMMTQGWTRYSWKQMAGVEPFTVKYPMEKSLVIDGRVLSSFGKKPKENVEVDMILMAGGMSQRGTCPTDKNGEFNLALADFQGTGNLILETKVKGKRKEHYIMLNRTFSPDARTYSFYEQGIQEQKNRTKDVAVSSPDSSGNKSVNLPLDQKSHLLPEVMVKDKMRMKREAEGLRYANVVYDVEQTIDVQRDKGEDDPVTIYQFLGQTNPYFNYIEEGDKVTCTYKGRKVTFILNDRNINATAWKIEEILADQIQTVTISEKLGNSVRIYLYTYKDNHYRKEPLGIRNTKLEGYAYVKEFYSPRYDSAILPDENDFRRTLYWNPDVKTDKEGKASISFYNNGTCRFMSISAETVTPNGAIGALNK